MRATANAMPGTPSRHLLEVKTAASISGCADRSSGSAPNADTASTIIRRPSRAHHGADRRHVVDDAAAGLAVDHADMADRRVGLQRGGDRVGIGRRGRRHRQQHRHAAGLARQADHAVGVGAGRRDQQLAPERHEGAHRRLGDEMAAALQRQRRRARPARRRRCAARARGCRHRAGGSRCPRARSRSAAPRAPRVGW